MNHTPIILTGMHRSGTSFTSSILHNAGVNMGDDMIPGNICNIPGFFEDNNIVEFHKNILSSNNLDPDGWSLHKVNQVSEEHKSKALKISSDRKELWGWKDPRTVFFLDFWKEVAPDAIFIFVFREPWMVVDSLFRRGDPVFVENPAHAFETYDFYNKLILAFYERNKNRSLIVNVNDLVKNPNVLIQKINERFGQSLKNIENTIFRKELFKVTVSAYDKNLEILNKHLNTSSYNTYLTLCNLADSLVFEVQGDYNYLNHWLLSSMEISRMRLEAPDAAKFLQQAEKENEELKTNNFELYKHREYLEQRIESLVQGAEHLNKELDKTKTDLAHAMTEFSALSQVCSAMKNEFDELNLKYHRIKNNRWWRLKERFDKIFKKSR